METNEIEKENLEKKIENRNGIKAPIRKNNIVKKLIIKNFESPQLPKDYLTLTWNKLNSAILSIHNSKPSKYSNEELYREVRNLCTHQMEPVIYQRLRSLIEGYVKENIFQKMEAICDNVTFLNTMAKHWISFCNQMIMIRCIFLYMDRTYVLQNQQICSVWDMGLEIFGKNMIGNSIVKTRLQESLLELIAKERIGEKIDRILIKNNLRMLIDLNYYQMLFETRFLEETKQLYMAESEKNIACLTLSEYLYHIEKRITEEEERLAAYLDFSTSKKLIPIIEKEMIENNLDKILQMNFDQLLDGHKLEVLKLGLSLFTRVEDGLPKFCLKFNKYIKDKGLSIIKATPEQEKNVIKELLDFKDKMDEVVVKSFSSNARFINSLKEAFEYFINQISNKPAVLIAKFVDSKLRAGNKECGDEELEKLLDKVMVLFRFIHGKDIFEAFYKKDLAKRFLLEKSASIDAEKSMLLKLKQECGSAFTSKLEGMFKDMELSRELTPNFKQHLNNVMPNANIDLTVFILTTGYWPTYQTMDINIPSELLDYEELFNSFYLSKHLGRKLTWQRHLGHCVLKAHFKNNVKELQVSFLQAIVLLLFNESDELSFSEIHNKTKMEENELKRILQSLACGKARVITKMPKSKDVFTTDKFIFNNEFTNKLYRIKINQIQLKETPEENASTQERVFQDRLYQIDAAVVRIMKTRKSLSHNALISAIYEHVKFPPTQNEVKKRIDSLVERDYLTKDKENPNSYNYVA